MTATAYYRLLLIEALKTATVPLTLAEVVEQAVAVGMEGGARPADVGGLSGRVANVLLRGLQGDRMVGRVEPAASQSPEIRYVLTQQARASLPPAHVKVPPPFPRPVSMDAKVVRKHAPRPPKRDPADTAVEDFCHDFMADTAGLMNRIQREIAKLQAKYEKRYRELRTAR